MHLSSIHISYLALKKKIIKEKSIFFSKIPIFLPFFSFFFSYHQLLSTHINYSVPKNLKKKKFKKYFQNLT